MRRRHVVFTLTAVVAATTLGGCVFFVLSTAKRRKQQNPPCRSRAVQRPPGQLRSTFASLVGNTPLVRIESLSEALGVEVLGKAEFLNPGGSVKDRVAVQILSEAGGLPSGGVVVEGTSGSTGISLALAANSIGRRARIFMPSDQAVEKRRCLETLNAELRLTPTVGASHPEHYTNQAAASCKDGDLFADQFENIANFNAHHNGTAREILEQTGGRLDGFVASVGTGGTLAGCAARLKEHRPSHGKQIKVVAADPTGSGVACAVEYGVMFNDMDCEGKRRRVFVDTIVEGVGLNRLTRNFAKGLPFIDAAYRVSDLEAVHMAHWLIKHDGLFCGSSSAINCCAVVKAVMAGLFQPGDRVVVILCDSGVRHLSRFYNHDVLERLNLLPKYLRPNNMCDYKEHCGTQSMRAASVEVPPHFVFDFVDKPPGAAPRSKTESD